MREVGRRKPNEMDGSMDGRGEECDDRWSVREKKC